MLKSFHFNSPDELISNTYVFGNEGRGCYIIDLGKFDSRIEKYINEHHNGIIYAIILTNGHFEHISGIKTVLDKGYNPVLFISSEEEEFLENTRLNCSSMYKEEITLNYGNKILVDDEDEIDFKDGYVLKVIQTSGHTRGSVCYLVNKENALFSGDTLFKDGIGRTDLPTGSIKEMRKSLEKLSKLDPNLVVYPGHGDPTTIKSEFKNIGGNL